MTTRNGVLPNLCLFCRFNAQRLLSARTPAGVPTAPQLIRSFSATTLALRQIKGASKKKVRMRLAASTGAPLPYRSGKGPVRFDRGGPPRFANSRSIWRDQGKQGAGPKLPQLTPYQELTQDLSQDEVKELYGHQPDSSSVELQDAPVRRELDSLVKRATADAAPTPNMLKDEHAYLAGHIPKDMTFKELRDKWGEFRSDLIGAFRNTDLGATGSKGIPSRRQLEIHYRAAGASGLKRCIEKAFLSHMGYTQTPGLVLKHGNMEMAADVRFPQEWFTGTRQLHRTWHLHVGPTNSGKTYHALKRLEESGNGIYAGPLRLLAQEIYERMNAKGIPCNLIMGDDIKIVDELATVHSSTMEMVDLNREVEVCVIDEIQMIGDEDRGWAWTEAVLGVRAKEVHMCGEERTVEVIQKLAASVGDKLIIHRYKRLGPLEVERESLEGDLKKVQKGDCVVTFSRRNIFALKRAIEEQTGKRCAVIYGTLPPETRSMQARLFNDPDSEYDVLVASDAVGMGLNLSIKRVIFEATEKWNGTQTKAISIPHIKQIAGRAGRYKAPKIDARVDPKDTCAPLPAAPCIGYVTTLDKPDLKAVRRALASEVQPIKTAGILPQSAHIELFASQFPPTKKFSQILQKMSEYIRTSPIFHPCSLEDNIKSAQLFDDIKDLSVNDRMIFVMAPIGRDPKCKLAVVKMAECVAQNKDGSILEIPSVDLEALDITPCTIVDLQRLEALHKTLIVYLWLSYRFPATFNPRETAQELKALCEKLIEKGLQAVRFTRKKLTRGRRVANAVAESLDPDAMANLEDEHVEPEEHVQTRAEAKAFAAAAAPPTPALASPVPSAEELRQQKVIRDEEEDLEETFFALTGLCGNCGHKGHTGANCPHPKTMNRFLGDEKPTLKGEERV